MGRLADRMGKPRSAASAPPVVEPPEPDRRYAERPSHPFADEVVPHNHRDVVLPKPDTLEYEMALATVAKHHLQGWPAYRISKDLGVGREIVTKYLNVLRHRWASVAYRDIDASIQEELAKIALVEAEHWSAWKRSKLNDLPVVEAQRLRKQYGITIRPTGDPAFLDGVMKCIDRRIKILGLDAPIKIDIEAKVRMMAEAVGLDPDAAVEEAKRVIAEARAGVALRLAEADG